MKDCLQKACLLKTCYEVYPKLSRESCFTLSFNYAGVHEDRSTKEATGNFQCRALQRKIIETLKTLVFSFIMVNLESTKVHFIIRTAA